jgi:hypothetical protein
LNGRQWVIGTTGDGISMDIGFSNTSQGNTSHNPHHGIAGYIGTTFMRFRENGNMGLGSAGDWGALGGGEPGYALDTRGHLYNNSRVDAPIFYDANNTGYYVDPNSNTNLYGTFQVSGGHGDSQIGVRLLAGNNGAATGEINLRMWASEPGVTWDWAGFGYNVTNNGGSPSGFGRLNGSHGQAYMRFSTGGDLYFYNTNTSGTRFSAMDLYASNYIYVHNYLQGGNSLRAPIFFDSNNTGYYVNPDGASYIWTLQTYSYQGHGNVGGTGNASWHPSGIYSAGYNWLYGGINGGGGSATNFGDVRANIFYDNNDTATYIDPNNGGFVLRSGSSNRVTLTTNDSGFRVQNAEGNGVSDVRLGAAWGRPGIYSSTYLSLGSDGSYIEFVTGNGQRGYIDSSSNMFAFGSMRSPIFYDQNNTAYYVDPTGFSEFGTTGLVASFTKLGTGPNSRALQVANNQGDNSWGIVAEFRVNGGPGGDRPSIMFSNGFDSNTWSCGFGFADSGLFRIKHDHGHRSQSWGTTDFSVDRGGNTFSEGSSRAPIFYDTNNTAYYTDPTGYSQMSSGEANSYWRVARLDFIGVGGNSGQGDNAYNIFQEGGGWGFPFPDLRIAYHTGIKFGANPSYEGMRFYNDYPMGSLIFQVNGSNEYLYKYRWMYTNTTGFYSDTVGFHWYPNNGESAYGSANLLGSRNGWWGIHFNGGGNLPHVMFESGNGGFYFQGNGKWALYHSNGNNCVGINTSATSSGYGMYVNRGIFATEDIVAYSDRRKKKNIITIDNALSKVLNLRGVYYNRIDKLDYNPDKRFVGVIAQEVEKILPEVVTYAEDVDEYGVSYGNFAGLFIEAIKEQNEIIKKQAEEIAEMKEILNKLIFNNKK